MKATVGPNETVCPGCGLVLESQHRSNPLLHTAMILLHDVVQVFTGPNPHAPTHASGRFQFPNRPMRSGVPVESDHPWRAIVSDYLAEEPFRRTHIPPFTQEEIHASPVLVHGSIKIGPSSSNLYICLITAPGTVDWACIPVPTLLKFRNIPLYPMQNRRMCQGNASFRHDLDQIPGAELETQVPPHAEDNDFAIKVSSFKQIHSGPPSAHSPIMTGAPRF